ncbi:hypothetical protein RIF29_32833 [Crotalaria pallida]|uniref:Uncharacterized protein n=1 Tax=Crotalaria pallida TaxID=3830 RepID=A0AAN9ENT0_CROPI
MADESEKASVVVAETTQPHSKHAEAEAEEKAPQPTDITTALEEVKEKKEEEEEKVKKEEEEEEEELVDEKMMITQSVSFKEETNVVADLPQPHKKALLDLKLLLQDALNNHHLLAPPTPPPPSQPPPQPPKEEEEADKKEEENKKEEEEEKADEQEKKKEEKAEETVSATDEEKAPPSSSSPAPPLVPPEEVELWGIPLLADERSDVILLKFLRARDFKVKEALTMLKNTVRWRKEFGIDGLVEEDLGSDWEKVVFTEGYDREGHPVCYNVFGEFEKKELYNKTFSDEEKREKFIRWRIQLLEKSVRKLDFAPRQNGISTIVQVNDLNNSPGLLLAKRDLRQATNLALQLLQDNYPELVAKQVFINVPWWYLAFYRFISAFLTQRTKSKFVFAGPSKSAETLFKYIAPELVPVQYGGLSREGEQEFTTADPATEATIKPATKHTVEFPVSETSHVVWEVRVVGWEVNYGAEFVPSAEEGYTVLVQKSRKIAPTDETIISNSFKVGEAGKVVLTIDNQTSKKKKLLYRFKTKPIIVSE